MREQRTRDMRRRRLDEIKPLGSKCRFRNGNRLAVVNCRIQTIAFYRVGDFNLECDVENEALSEPGLFFLNTVLREQHQSRDVNGPLHRPAPRIASAIFSACACAATS